MPPSELKDDVRRRVEQIIASEPSFPFVLNAVRRWPSVVYLAARARRSVPPADCRSCRRIPRLPAVRRRARRDRSTSHRRGRCARRLLRRSRARPARLPAVRDVAREAWLVGHTPSSRGTRCGGCRSGRRDRSIPAARLAPMPQIHLRAEAGDYAPLVLLPGDPGRATMIAGLFDGGLDNARLVNQHRSLLGYTGTYQRQAGQRPDERAWARRRSRSSWKSCSCSA